MNQVALMPFFAFLFGLALGSFANVCIWRIPLGKSLVSPPSACPHCQTPIKFYDNIPILSYLVLRGKCRHCKGPISLQYPVVEAVMGLLSLVLFIRYGPRHQYIIYLIFHASLLIITFIDLHHKIIPDVISLPGIAVGFLYSLLPGPPSWMDSAIGILAGGLGLMAVAMAFELITGKEGMGGGDIKLLAMIGAWLGWKALPFVVLISSVAGTIIGGGALLITKKELGARIPFGPFLALGAVVYFFFGHALISFYLGLLGGG